MQFDSNFVRLVTKSEPGAVATGQGLNGKAEQAKQSLWRTWVFGRSLPLPVLILYWLRLILKRGLRFNIENASVPVAAQPW